MSVVFTILTLYSWVIAGFLIGFLTLIARFYEKKYAELYRDAAQHRTYYALLLVPLVLFLFAALRYAFLDDFVGDVIGDLAFFVGGIVLAALSYRLQRLMTGGRR